MSSEAEWKRRMRPSLGDWGFAAAVVVLAALALMLVALAFVVMGYSLGLWEAPCAINGSQPHCIAAGWGHVVVVRHR